MSDINAVGVTVISRGPFPGTAGLPPLTTRFTYASSCTSHWVQYYPGDPYSDSRLYSDYNGNNHFASCLPSRRALDSSLLRPLYSPGICPSGHRIATITESITVPSQGDEGRVWLGRCCPIGYGVLDNGYCTSSATYASDGPAIAYRAAIVTYTTTRSGSAITTSSLDYNASTNTTTMYYASFLVEPIGIFWKASDLSLFEHSYASALASRIKVSFAATPTPTTMPPSQTASPGSSFSIPGPTSAPLSPNLSTGAKAGIGVGAAFGALAIVVALFLIFRWRKRKSSYKITAQTHDAAAVEAPELVQYYNPVRQSEALSGTTYIEQTPKTPSSPMSPRPIVL